jgi:hypothetical protein
MKELVVFAWNYVFNHEVNPLRHIPNIVTRHTILQILGLVWAIAASVALGSYTIFAASALGHDALIAAAATTVTTSTLAATKPEIFKSGLGRHRDGEHECAKPTKAAARPFSRFGRNDAKRQDLPAWPSLLSSGNRRAALASGDLRRSCLTRAELTRRNGTLTMALAFTPAFQLYRLTSGIG